MGRLAGPIIGLAGLPLFVQGYAWDEQRKDGVFYPQFVSYATVAIGIYGAATGTSEATLLTSAIVYTVTVRSGRTEAGPLSRTM